MIVLCSLLILLICIYTYYFPPIPKRKKHYSYALLLGCPSHDDGSMSTSQIQRCNLAIQAYQKGLYDTLIISGSSVKNKYVEAKVMHAYIKKKFSIPCILETNAKNTFENFKFSKPFIKNKSFLILTSSTHKKRACAIARHFFNNYSAYSYPDRKIKHIIREIHSRAIYIQFEIKKKIGR